MKIQPESATKTANIIIDFFSNINRIDDYFRLRKIERVKDLPVPIPGFGLEDDMFQNYDMYPEDMAIEVTQIDNQTFNAMLEKVASFSPDQAPGKELKLVVKEKNTNTLLGFIKLGSPIINSKPRNNYLGDVPDLTIFNQRAIMGFVIVPVQPFGFNYLGGKLLALICCSHKVREMLNDKYDTEFCLFETTSLYGNIKGASMYDGMRPYLKYKGDTMSSFLLTMGEDIYPELRKWFEEKNEGPLVKKTASSRKLKTQTKMIGMVKASLKEHDTTKYNKFCETIKTATDVTTQKRFYMSDYGYANSKDVLTGKTDVLVKSESFEKYSLENITKWWKKKATKRYEKLKTEGRNRHELEYWNAESIDKIDIIR
ncbi:DUF4338 domain-containing protein [Marine Group I thaumarchaeote]|uniref:DUF4338 domain-containing protein n=1 Tax=Marine Group I thaumarchaeote TaxID=2511932 RepID=A0A7K4MRL3_9ARCH|nr:DUF4338 domain-containing protein [Marine Group I thaumarchaeote]